MGGNQGRDHPSQRSPAHPWAQAGPFRHLQPGNAAAGVLAAAQEREAGGGSHLGVSPAGSGGQPTGASVGVWAHSYFAARFEARCATWVRERGSLPGGATRRPHGSVSELPKQIRRPAIISVVSAPAGTSRTAWWSVPCGWSSSLLCGYRCGVRASGSTAADPGRVRNERFSTHSFLFPP